MSLQEIKVHPPPPNLYRLVKIADINLGTVKHTHVAVIATVDKAHNEKDGDVHLHLSDDGCHGLVCEIIPELPFSIPVIGSKIKVSGILRFDGEHNWWELHPIIKIEPA